VATVTVRPRTIPERVFAALADVPGASAVVGLSIAFARVSPCFPARRRSAKIGTTALLRIVSE
jgi:hypothetical protein